MHRHLAGIVLLATSLQINGPAVAQEKFDGHWRIEAIPETGACIRTRRYALVVENGAIRKSKTVTGTITGGLEASGRIQGSLQRSKGRLNVTGNLSSSSGSGVWSTSGTVACAGRWVAHRQS